LAGGLIGGTLSVRPELARLRAAPGLPALFFAPAAALTVEAGARLKPELLTWPLEVIWGVPSWPFLFAAAAAGLAFNLRPRRLWRLTWPALAAGLWLSADRIGLNVTWLPYFDLTRLVALTLPVFFIIPALARSGRDLVAAEALGLIFLWLPLPATGLFALDRSLPPLAAALAAWFWLSWRWRRGRSAVAPPPPKPEPSAARARLKCGGGGRSPLAADWRGPTSCRLAAAQDGGPRLCPYGCLGLGDCRAVCPHGAIGRDEQGFPLARPQLCRGCGRCAAVCPRGLWELAAEPAQAFIPCASRAALKQSAELCPVSCLGCGRCRKACPAGAIIRTGRVGAPQVDRALCRAGGQTCAAACASACPRRIIRAPAEDSSAGGQYGEAATSRITSP
jgi:Fe-S-cluster-containing hydrogenase component 2